MQAKLIFENGTIFNAKVFGDFKNTVGEVVFSTGMPGYQESLTDPSFAGSIVVMTFPLVGNYGINSEDMESEKVWPKAIIVREKCDFPSNFRCEKTLDNFLKENNVVGLYDVDTRKITKMIRDNGIMKAVITKDDISFEDAQKLMNEYESKGLVKEVSSKEKYIYSDKGDKHVAFIDLGTKAKLLQEFKNRNCKVTVFPYDATKEEILKANPDFVFLSSGPGNPYDCEDTINTIKELMGKLPIYGVCLGHLIIAIALGCKVEKMKFGHHGGNYPVKNLASQRVYITSQGHSYGVAELAKDVENTYVNVNDNSCEGIKCEKLKISSVQFHPEAAPGPVETSFVFDMFVNKED